MTISPGLIEEISIKLILDFLTHLKKSRIILSDIKVDFYDRQSHTFLTYNNLASVSNDYYNKYVPSNKEKLGSLVGIQQFLAVSDISNFSISYSVNDMLGSYQIRSTNSFDIKRNSQRQLLKNHQLEFLKSIIDEYIIFYNMIRSIYIDGIYSPNYAIPGWTQGTYFISSLKEYLNDSTNISKFPYAKDYIKKFPPNN